MANKKKKRLKKFTFQIRKNEFKEIVNRQLDHIDRCRHNRNTLCGLKITIDDNIAEFVSTNGNTLLETKITLEESANGIKEAILDGAYLLKLKINRNYNADKRAWDIFDMLEITLDKEEAVIKDVFNKIEYKIPYLCGVFPNYKQLIPNCTEEKYIKIGINPQYLVKLAKLADSNGMPIVLNINKEKPGTAAIFIEKELATSEVRGLIMPTVIGG